MITSTRMAAIDRNAEALGVPRRALMESSANAVARAVADRAADDDRVSIICGLGNNGGDGLAAARFLDEVRTTVTLCGHPDRFSTSLARANWDTLQAAEAETRVWSDSSDVGAIDADIVVDALLGTGVTGPVREPVASAIEAINASSATTIAVDIPSGVDPDSGESASVAVGADHVVTFHDRKPGLDAVDATVSVADIGIPEAAARFVGPGDIEVAGGRDPDAHKGAHGRILVIGGGPYTGAPALAAAAALRGGADLVDVAVPANVAETVASYHPEFIVHSLSGDRLEPTHLDRILELAVDADGVVIGPGLGDDPDTEHAIEGLLERYDGRLVVDADALAVFAETGSDATVIATPHAGEFEAMGFTRPADWRVAESIVADAADECDATIVLKGRYDVISNGSVTRVNRTGNPGMTVGGTGDVLTGLCGAHIVRQKPVDAACIAAWRSGRAGDICQDDIGTGFLPSDILEAIPQTTATSHTGDHVAELG